ncbi:hypothetical protein [Rudaeicoccus suwonensis]|uniref:N-acetyltransferase domain-containing protein n=1 Tax=Rudaeicoccus suwonensis TaxID=657409 RepID=A0A561EB23_9MICO|nr:hypothetical protein [Rudaeicoccus suwonensis]TWE12815.1 hypothetical protein BKA23_1635 [Rudaeicoccus suwonensis]
MAASDAWRWIPPEATSFEIDGVQVIHYPAWAFTEFSVTPLATGLAQDELPTLIARVRSAAIERSKSSMEWWISPSTAPDGFGDALLTAGASLDETCDIYAFDMSERLPDVGPVDGIETVLVTDETALDDYELVGNAVWGAPPAKDERRAHQLAELAKPDAEQTGWRVVAYADGRPVANGGLEVVDGVARLWGAATLEDARGRGAYRAVLLRRLQVGRDHGATLALVHARIGTSGPIVRRCGFTSYGRGYSYLFDLGKEQLRSNDIRCTVQ